MKNFRIILLTVMFCAVLLTLGCGPNRTVSRVSSDEVTDLSGNWNDTDSKLVAQQMIQDMVYRPWISDFMMEEDRKPVVIVGTIRNFSSEHIQTDTFIKDIERELINAGKVKFVASSKEREEIRDERMEQQSYASDDTAKRLAAESGADFMLQGGIKSNVDASGGKAAKFYQIDLELINVETNEKVWIGSKEIKKLVNKKKTKW
ncbi:MAG: penicillin-binding protein activator LpoB [Candidatus Cloacimonetes bacterium]|nr:penicillin-binding protein activator LpoB [Candidatus Cloacimonadota bacterium]MCF7813586.1 penicillin-binding protein activator LpoB [Candidatus Cloacimonadota bacterium]MCF7868217.1 penicillin-binding protein activator LpoB [Candidatus Cloacimonadota bacterium]MCF7883619.1 penicillin-binding protein activator LpoB [Candidatus Cloacimonadota bacterium]